MPPQEPKFNLPASKLPIHKHDDKKISAKVFTGAF